MARKKNSDGFTNRRIKVSMRKVVQERQYEPIEICIGVETDIPDEMNMEEAIGELEVDVFNETERILEDWLKTHKGR